MFANIGESKPNNLKDEGPSDSEGTIEEWIEEDEGVEIDKWELQSFEWIDCWNQIEIEINGTIRSGHLNW